MRSFPQTIVDDRTVKYCSFINPSSYPSFINHLVMYTPPSISTVLLLLMREFSHDTSKETLPLLLLTGGIET